MSGSVVNSTTENAFACVLVFYFNYRRSKLKSQDLAKIAKKYGQKSSQMLHDLAAKYQLPILSKANAVEVLRICNMYDVPEVYKRLLPLNILSMPYDGKIDVLSSQFDADYVFEKKNILAVAHQPTPLFDNMSKLRHLIPGFDGFVFQTFIPSAKSGTEKPKEKSIHLVHRIAISSTEKIKWPDPQGKEILMESPFELLYNILKEKTRAHIVIRRFNSVRGWVEGHVRAFDKHMNVVLTDVDEHYAVNKTRGALAKLIEQAESVSTTAGVSAYGVDASSSSAVGGSNSSSSSHDGPGRSRGVATTSSAVIGMAGGLSSLSSHPRMSKKHPLLIRHLPHLLIRGDNVVLVSRAQSVYRHKRLRLGDDAVAGEAAAIASGGRFDGVGAGAAATTHSPWVWTGRASSGGGSGSGSAGYKDSSACFEGYADYDPYDAPDRAYDAYGDVAFSVDISTRKDGRRPVKRSLGYDAAIEEGEEGEEGEELEEGSYSDEEYEGGGGYEGLGGAYESFGGSYQVPVCGAYGVSDGDEKEEGEEEDADADADADAHDVIGDARDDSADIRQLQGAVASALAAVPAVPPRRVSSRERLAGSEAPAAAAMVSAESLLSNSSRGSATVTDLQARGSDSRGSSYNQDQRMGKNYSHRAEREFRDEDSWGGRRGEY